MGFPTFTQTAMRQPCEICSTDTKSICYKLYVCGACTMFYRRNFRYWGRLNCRMGGKCNLTAGLATDRRTCRACRLRACRNLGLRMIGKSLVVQQDGMPEDDILEPEESKKCQCKTGKCCNSGNNIVEAPASSPSSGAPSPAMKTRNEVLENLHNSVTSPPTPSASSYARQSPAASQLARDVAISMSEAANSFAVAPSAFRPFSHLLLREGVPSTSFHELEKYPQLMHLKRVVDVFKRLRERQRLIVLETMNINVELEPEPPRLPPVQIFSTQYPVMERKMAKLCCMAIVEFLEGCIGLTIEEKVQIMKPTMLDVSFLFKLYLTVRRHPEIGNPTLSMFTGVDNNFDRYDVYMSDLLPILGPEAYMKHYHKSKTLVEPYFKKCKNVMDKFRDFVPDVVELAVLCCMSVYERMESIEVQQMLAMRLRDKLCAELSVYLSDIYPSTVVSVRMMRMATLLYAVRQCDDHYEDMFSLLGVMIPENRHHDFQNMPDVVPEQMHELASAGPAPGEHVAQLSPGGKP